MTSKGENREARIFFADTRFQRMARRPGGVTRKQAIEGAQAEVNDLKSDFPNWLERELQGLSIAIKQLEESSGDMSGLDRLYLSCCQLNDVGTTMGFVLLTFVANSLCEILDAIKAGATYDRDIIGCHYDALVLAKTAPYRNLRPEQLPEMTEGLRRLVELAKAYPAK